MIYDQLEFVHKDHDEVIYMQVIIYLIYVNEVLMNHIKINLNQISLQFMLKK